MESCSSNLALALLFVTALATIQSTTAQNSPQDYVDSHNSARAAVGVGPVSWDDTVAAYAQRYAEQRIGDCQLIHSGGPYGEIIFEGSGRDYSAADAVNSWVSEEQYYDYNSNTCASGQVCEHYTQVVWANSVKIGCARVKCNNGAIFITCNYSPPALATIQSTTAQNSPQDFVDSHNSARAAVGVGPVSWDDTVAAYAQNYANKRIGDCQLIHSGGPYGENIFGGPGRDYSAADAVNSWVSEKQYYDYNRNTCASGKVCGHYTQVVWANSVKIGCARVKCNSGAIFITCNYNPPGNYIGQRPY